MNQKNGKFIPEKVGLKAIQRNDLDYEFTIVFDVDVSHNAKASKDRTGLFIDKPEFVINATTGKRIKDWCEAPVGLEEDDIINEIKSCNTLDGLRHLYSKYINTHQDVKPLIMQRKHEIEQLKSQIIFNQDIIKNQNISKNGINN